ncbi:hypothetical protein P280DRAFT_517384 [Massarina eburnea CBS 473.64]|uniref:Cell death in tomato 1 n=1 Tax=Massarina eburnea CBS 473.64 TaxID=1395130 RepID=A0A6A6S214_9PLEO|nr:hypothetical protein P280DRAFT_517384 [Massarina eburnea CBS 473.64]
MFAKPLLAALLATTTTLAFPTASNTSDPQPWQILSLNTHSSSGRPGNDLNSTLFVSIHDPNLIEAYFPPVTANCSVKWLPADGAPYGVPQNCTEIAQGYWTVTIGEGESGSSATENLNLEFKLVRDATVSGESVVKVFTGGDHFEVGENMSGQCGGSGVCNWQLTNPPYDIEQTEQPADE